MARDKKKEQQIDTYLLEKIQPQGGITFMDANTYPLVAAMKPAYIFLNIRRH